MGLKCEERESSAGCSLQPHCERRAVMRDVVWFCLQWYMIMTPCFVMWSQKCCCSNIFFQPSRLHKDMMPHSVYSSEQHSICCWTTCTPRGISRVSKCCESFGIDAILNICSNHCVIIFKYIWVYLSYSDQNPWESNSICNHVMLCDCCCNIGVISVFCISDTNLQLCPNSHTNTACPLVENPTQIEFLCAVGMCEVMKC